ncbi:MAG: M48 family metalloprotease [Blastocatellia bacterium]
MLVDLNGDGKPDNDELELQYGFYGLGLVLSLSLLGVSRDYEIEADILGTQYLWHAGYNTKGFINFFGRMAAEEGYVTGLSWFRTHPPFYERMEKTYREIVLLPKQTEVIDDSSQFHQMKERLKASEKEMEDLDRKAPTLRRVYDCDDVPAESGDARKSSPPNRPSK